MALPSEFVTVFVWAWRNLSLGELANNSLSALCSGTPDEKFAFTPRRRYRPQLCRRGSPRNNKWA
eukprot:670915-Amphidinium_carterae.1